MRVIQNNRHLHAFSVFGYAKFPNCVSHWERDYMQPMAALFDIPRSASDGKPVLKLRHRTRHEYSRFDKFVVEQKADRKRQRLL